MSNDRLEPFNYHNITFKRCADVVSLGRLDRLWFLRHHWFMKIGWLGKKIGFKAQTCWTELLVFWGVWNRSRILIFGPEGLFSGFPEPCRGIYYVIMFFYGEIEKITAWLSPNTPSLRFLWKTTFATRSCLSSIWNLYKMGEKGKNVLSIGKNFLPSNRSGSCCARHDPIGLTGP